MRWMVSLSLLFLPLLTWGHHTAEHTPDLLQQVSFEPATACPYAPGCRVA